MGALSCFERPAPGLYSLERRSLNMGQIALLRGRRLPYFLLFVSQDLSVPTSHSRYYAD